MKTNETCSYVQRTCPHSNRFLTNIKKGKVLKIEEKLQKIKKIKD